MIKKILLLLIPFLLSSFDTTTAQIITFEKYFPALGRSTTGYKIYQTSDEGFLAGGYKSDSLLIIKFSKEGNILWKKSLSSGFIIQKKFYPVSFVNDSDIIVIGNTLSGEDRIILSKINTNWDTVWTKIYDGDYKEYGSEVIELNDGNIMLVGGKRINSSRYKRTILLKTNPDGELIWKNEFNQTNSPDIGYRIIQLSDSSIVISGDKYLSRFTQDGDSLWTVHFEIGINTINPTSDKSIILSKSNQITKINSDGSMDWESTVKGYVRDVIQTNDESYVCISDSHSTAWPYRMLYFIQKFDTNGNFLKINEISGRGYDIIQTSDNGYAAVGTSRDYNIVWDPNYFYILKTDEDLNYKSLNLLRPNEGKFANRYTITLEWIYKDVGTIDISYSSDNGISWNVLETNYPAETENYSWDLTGIVSDNCLVKINDSFYPDINDISDNIFSIVPFFMIGDGNIPGNDMYDYIAINDIFMWISNNGDGSHDPRTDGNGLYWPDGLNAYLSAVFEDGLVFGGIVNEKIYVNGSTHRQGLQAGYILTNGQASNPDDPKNKIWKIRKDWQSLPEGKWKDQYEYDYNNWPGELGAPFIDTDGDGVFTSGIDEPNFIGDEVLFYVANDLDPSRTSHTYGSDPIGLEFQTSVWGFNTDDFLKDVVFKQYRIINKGDKLIENMYLAYWMDDDMGDANDDYVGCDTLLNLAYTYNGDEFDDDYYRKTPPAVGHMMLHGPVVPANQSDSAHFNYEWHEGYKNIMMTSYVIYISPDAVHKDPQQGQHKGAIEFYNNMQGLVWNGNPYINPNTGEITKFIVPGDPVEGTGWYEGEGWDVTYPSPGDRRHLLSSGPFNMAPGDTQEVVYAIFMARGSDRIQSVAELKKTARMIHEFRGNKVVSGLEESVKNNNVTPVEFSLSQNYPNPFNPSTIIKYEIPSTKSPLHRRGLRGGLTAVKLAVYDILGREIAVLVNKEQSPGSYEVVFRSDGLSSGIYFYKLTSGNYQQTKKIILLR
ncbi:T9SS type A sorting domain-containing protein [Bacteroidota bacterium]